MADIVTILFFMIVIGVVLYFVNRAIPMSPTIKMLINVVIVLLVIAWLLKMFGLLNWK